jgi:accessory gene regulator protein AgrB
MNGRINTEKFKMGMGVIRQDSMVSQVVFAIAMVVSTMLEATLSFGVLPTTALSTPGAAV